MLAFLILFASFETLVAKPLFPLDNTARQVFLGVVRFYSVDNVSGLRCDANIMSTLLFWIFGHWVLHGKFIRFMKGENFTVAVTLGNNCQGKFDSTGVKKESE